MRKMIPKWDIKGRQGVAPEEPMAQYRPLRGTKATILDSAN